MTNLRQIEREKLEQAGTVHWFHWLIVGLSLCCTLFAWYYSKSQLNEKIESRFEREADQAVELVRERMQRYEDALWGGVAYFETTQQEIELPHWKKYVDSLKLMDKYPGVNGMGVIHRIQADQLPAYLEKQRRWLPEYRIHPDREAAGAYWPISFIVPVDSNDKAIGLDMAHETNRFSAAQRARDTGKAQITAPITLVQDEGQTPGFLFFAPFYQGERPSGVEERSARFQGMVYAPFVVKELADGTLEKEKRHLGIRITDGEQVLLDEHHADESDYDPHPLFTKMVQVPMYGRTWTFDIWSSRSFREAASSSEPWTILIGGLVLDGLLAGLFVMISRASRQALVYAEGMTHELEQQKLDLTRSNAELEQFAYVASHDLQQPLRAVASCCQVLLDDHRDKLDDDGKKWLDMAIDGSTRMKVLVQDLLALSRIGTHGKTLQTVDTQGAAEEAVSNLRLEISEKEGDIRLDPLPLVQGDSGQLVQLFQNLIENGVKYSGKEKPLVTVGARRQGKEWLFSVSDNGIGIAEQYRERIFVIFQRLHRRDEYSGSGIGLAICKKIVERHRGRIWVESKLGGGSTFYFTLPAADQPLDRTQNATDRQLT
ncbi:sensor histidine kinase [Lignipirellula cremea]|uniref:histidine kinase n=1 Tax=Lignipirellula cremea TaxID=2528010 RepID=A0A518DSH4_9BACT|nr:CHASE domain-containing protein [Lignipirellula cremea]QDU94787.1 Phytochrome-like protein cph1 [Lignipirellula cremea]